MVNRIRSKLDLVAMPLGTATAGLACYSNQWWLAAAGLATAGYSVADWWVFAGRGPKSPPAATLSKPPDSAPRDSSAAEPANAQDLIAQMIEQHRYALLLRPEIVGNLTTAQFAAARAALDNNMALVPSGEVRIGAAPRRAERFSEDYEDEDEPAGIVVRVEPALLDRHCVTNAQFQQFVSSGGYEEIGLWDPEIWPGVLDFVDQSGLPGPRFWSDSRFLPGTEHHPVTGVCWYEATAYARWAGKRLPTDPEWEKAASWPVQLSASKRPQRRFPWGDALDRTKANLWAAGIGDVVPVNEFPDGVSVGGVYQMVGNVWEWTMSNFGALSFLDQELVLPTVLKSIRGGAFDTYFENHATCQFQSGEDPTARAANIGFRCAVSLCDVSCPVEAADEPTEESQLETVEAHHE
jgi:iron(II)-dependent oxidoreductase